MGAIKGRELTPVTCPLCGEYSSKRVTSLVEHLRSMHGREAQEVWDSLNGGRPTCACGCGGGVRWNGWGKGYSRVVNGHNGSIYAACSPEEAAAISEKRSAALRGKTSWAKGLTKESDTRVADRGAATARGRRAAFEQGDIEAWNKGKTKESDERVRAAAVALKESYAGGDLVPWAKGLTKESDERIAKMSEVVSLSLRERSIRDHLDSLKRLPPGEVRSRIEASGDLEVVDGLQGYVNDASRVIVVRCKACGDTFQGSLRILCKGRCFRCSPGGSVAQDEVARFVASLGVEVKRNDRKEMGLELDVFVPERRVAVEYNGLYWHCHINKSPNYHRNKTSTARDVGVSLVHVFEDEWRDKRPIVESIIRAKLGKCERRVGARACRVVELSSEQRKKFFEANHLDGDVRSEVAWGLEAGGDVVYALSLRRPFHKKYEGSLEVARCCPALGLSVPGGLSRLTKKAVEHCEASGVDKLVTYVDTRLGGIGRGYELSGFVKTSETVARWWWTDLTHRFNRFKFKADSATGRSEAEVAESAGVVKIWGCENVFYEMTIKSHSP